MAESTARLALPLIAPGQAQKEMSHNEALTLLDLATHSCVVAVGVDVPPVDPAAGACWIVGSTPSGAWAGQANAIAGWTDGGWRFVAAREGMAAWASGAEAMLRYAGGSWSRDVLATAVLPIAAPATGAVIDTQARAAIEAILAALEHHGLVETANL